MSFSTDIKNEIARGEPGKKCCQLAEIAGFIRMCGTMRLAGGGRVTLSVFTENPAVARHYKKLLKTYFDIDTNLQVGQAGFQKKGHLYELIVNAGRAEQVLLETGILRIREGFNDLHEGIHDGLLRTRCCRKAYLRGVFLAAGTVSDPEKSYHLEIVCNTEALAQDVRRLLNSFVDIHARVVQRKRYSVAYIKEAEQITDILNILGAHSQLLKFENVRILKELRNRTNRISNCDNANLDKTLLAAGRQIEAIDRIRERSGLDSLPAKLREIALLRLEHPDATLPELASMTDPPVRKSGVHHRLKKLESIAEKL